MGQIAEALADACYVTSDNPRTESPTKILQEILLGCADPTKIHADIDRQNTIQQAICNASSNDVILIAGKGHENYQILGHEKIYFSDAKIAGDALAHLANKRPSET